MKRKIAVPDFGPCPFCGSGADLEWFESRKGYEADILCRSCPAGMHTITYDTPEEAVAAAAAAWNRRAYPVFEDAIGRRIRARRGVRKISIGDLSFLTKLDERALIEIEAGGTPRVRDLARIAKALRCGLSKFLEFPSREAAEDADGLMKSIDAAPDPMAKAMAVRQLEHMCEGPVAKGSGPKEKEERP